MKNLQGKTVKPENAYQVYRMGDWTWYILKHYNSPEAEARDPYARVFCLVVTPLTGPAGDLGDVYLKDILQYAELVSPAPLTSRETSI